jgi:hypothetical protein
MERGCKVKHDYFCAITFSSSWTQMCFLSSIYPSCTFNVRAREKTLSGSPRKQFRRQRLSWQQICNGDAELYLVFFHFFRLKPSWDRGKISADVTFPIPWKCVRERAKCINAGSNRIGSHLAELVPLWKRYFIRYSRISFRLCTGKIVIILIFNKIYLHY